MSALHRTLDATFLNPEERLRAVRFGRAFHKLSPYRHEPFDEFAVLEFLQRLIVSENGYYDCSDVGGIVGLLTPLWFAPSTIIATELIWYSEEKGEGKRLREGFETWAKARGAKWVQFSALADTREETLRRVMARAGYDAVELAFRKGL